MSLESALDRFLDRAAPFVALVEDITKAPAKEPGWRKLHRIADALAPKLRKQFLAAVSAAKDGTHIGEIESALDRGDVEQAVKILDRAWKTHGAKIIEGDFLAPFMSAFQESGLVSVKLVSPKPFDFEVENPRGLKWAQQHAAELVVEVGDETRRGLKVQVERMLESGVSARETARAIRGVQGFGLTERQATAVENYRAGLIGQDVAPGKIDRMVSRYYSQMLDYRAMNIARTESMFAVNAGYQEALQQAVDEGLLNADATVRVWTTAGQDGAICDECWDLEGAEASIDGQFPGGADMPPLHPQCRCTVVTEQR